VLTLYIVIELLDGNDRLKGEALLQNGQQQQRNSDGPVQQQLSAAAGLQRSWKR
jgi:hypothetical protein